MSRIASILLPMPLPEAFDYAEPEGMELNVGDQVAAPLGPRLIHGVVTPPLKKVTLVATSEAQLTEMVKGVQAGVPAGHTLNETVRRAFPHTKLTLIVGGYDVIPPP